MTIIEAMDARRSRRKYLTTPIEDAKAELLRASVARLNAESGLHMQLVLNNGDAFNDLRTNYGARRGVYQGKKPEPANLFGAGGRS